MTQSLSYKTILSELRRQNFVEVPSLVTPEKALRAAEDFIEFLTLPQEIKDKFTVMTDEADRGSDSGYARRAKTEGRSDNKEFFNYRPLSNTLLAPVITKSFNNPRVSNFFNSIDLVFHDAVKTLEGIIKVIDTQHHGIYQKIFLQNPDRLLCLRFVKYDPVGEGEFLAKAHYDRGSCALAVAESALGLRIGRDGATLREVRRTGNTAIFMPAFTFARDVGSNEFNPAWHDVVQKGEAQYSQSVARWAMVLFADAGTENISYEDTHKPITKKLLTASSLDSGDNF